MVCSKVLKLCILETVSHISRFAKLSLLFPKNDFLSGSFDGRMQLEGFSISVTPVPAFDSSNEEGCKLVFFCLEILEDTPTNHHELKAWIEN